MDIRPNINDDYTLEIASQNNEQYRYTHQSSREPLMLAGSPNPRNIFRIASQGKDAIVTSPSVRRNLTHTIENIIQLKIAFPDQ